MNTSEKNVSVERYENVSAKDVCVKKIISLVSKCDDVLILDLVAQLLSRSVPENK